MLLRSGKPLQKLFKTTALVGVGMGAVGGGFWAKMRIDQLKRELAEYQTKEEQKIAHAIEGQRKMDEKPGKLHMDIELQRIRNSEDLDLDDKEISEEVLLWEAEVEQQLKRAAMAHAEHLEEVIRTQKQLHDVEAAQLVHAAVNIERNKFGKQIGSALNKLNAFELALSHAAEDLENRRAKIFWTACLNLMDTLLTGDGNSSEEVQMFTKLKEVKFIRELTEHDEFAQSICDRFSKRALDGEGVPTEMGLKKRFDRVYKLARECAQDKNGGGLFDYVRCMFGRKRSAEDKIDTQNYEGGLLENIKYFIGEGDLASAVRLANLLRGESAQIFRDWISDAQLHLEARLLADQLLRHAQVTSVRTNPASANANVHLQNKKPEQDHKPQRQQMKTRLLPPKNKGKGEEKKPKPTKEEWEAQKQKTNAERKERKDAPKIVYK